MIHHANAWEEDGIVTVWSTGWSPEIYAKLAKSQAREGLLGSWQRVPADLSDVPISALWAHRFALRTSQRRRCHIWPVELAWSMFEDKAELLHGATCTVQTVP